MTNSPRVRCGHAGFSLVEVVVAVMILGVALVGLTQGITTALQSSKDSEVQTGAVMMASGLIESLRAEGYLDDGETEGEGEGGFSRFRWKESIEPASVDGLHEVTATVLDKTSGKTVYELKTLLYDAPLGSSAASQSDRSSSSSSRTRDKRGNKRSGGR